MLQLAIPNPSLILLIGPAGSGKSTFARSHFGGSQVLSSDACRALVCDDESDQSVNQPAFEILHTILEKRMAHRCLTVVDATNVQPASRAALLAVARQHGIPSVAIVFLLPLEVCLLCNRGRARHVPENVVAAQWREANDSLSQLDREGFSTVYVLRNIEEVEAASCELLR